jgi:hypothetical protein
MDIIVRSLAWDSANSVMAWCLRSWKRRPAVELLMLLMSAPPLRQIAPEFCGPPHVGHFTARVRLLHADRQPLIGFVGSGLEYPSALGNTYQSEGRSAPKSIYARSLSRMMAL